VPAALPVVERALQQTEIELSRTEAMGILVGGPGLVAIDGRPKSIDGYASAGTNGAGGASSAAPDEYGPPIAPGARTPPPPPTVEGVRRSM
jgi:hypothetical protein